MHSMSAPNKLHLSPPSLYDHKMHVPRSSSIKRQMLSLVCPAGSAQSTCRGAPGRKQQACSMPMQQPLLICSRSSEK
jgi:hypothetical protein